MAEARPDEPSAESYTRDMFPENFVFGTATSAYQVEGAAGVNGRGPSIWDIFSAQTGSTIDGETGEVACDQYHRYEEDIAHMVDMGFTAYRFSISWSRILPAGRGAANPEGVAYYHRLIDALREKGLTPFVTLFHWDLPQALEEEYGGFLDDRVIEDFAHFADVCFSEFGPKVAHWITFNEPLTFSFCGYVLGIHAPGRGWAGREKFRAGEGDCGADENELRAGGKVVGAGRRKSGMQEGADSSLLNPHLAASCPDPSTEAYSVVHNILRSHATAVALFRRKHQPLHPGSVIGITVDSEWAEPLTQGEADVAAAQRRMEFQLAWLLDPLFSGRYPQAMVQRVGVRLPQFTPEEAESVKGSLDFVGLNHYTTKWVGDGHAPEDASQSDHFKDQGVVVSAQRDGKDIGLRAASEWLFIVPWGLQKLLLWIRDRYDNPPLFITENGMDDVNEAGKPMEFYLRDSLRVSYYSSYLRNVLLAMSQGVDVRGYFAWSLLDNFEWAMGYSHRFGLLFVDYENGLERVPKDSALWWKAFLKEDGESS